MVTKILNKTYMHKLYIIPLAKAGTQQRRVGLAINNRSKLKNENDLC